jgi:hypothetical protein
MIDGWLDQFVTGGWALAASRIIFVGLIYLFLYVVLRATVRELAAVARTMPSIDGGSQWASLTVEDGAQSSLRPGQLWPLAATTTIGRLPGNDVVIDDPYVSASHAVLQNERGQWWLRDLGSSNGTLLNGESVRAVVAVRHGDVLQCGRVRFRFISSTAVPIENASA